MFKQIKTYVGILAAFFHITTAQADVNIAVVAPQTGDQQAFGTELISGVKTAIDFINEAERESLCLVDITLITGRHHQIRVQFSHIGCPIWGDAKYNPDWNEKKNIGKIGLCAYELTFFHPITKQQMTVRY